VTTLPHAAPAGSHLLSIGNRKLRAHCWSRALRLGVVRCRSEGGPSVCPWYCDRQRSGVSPYRHFGGIDLGGDGGRMASPHREIFRTGHLRRARSDVVGRCVSEPSERLSSPYRTASGRVNMQCSIGAGMQRELQRRERVTGRVLSSAPDRHIGDSHWLHEGDVLRPERHGLSQWAGPLCGSSDRTTS
jgi:hypothetical protein